MLKLFISFLLVFNLYGCSPLSMFLPTGPRMSVDAQVGKENLQQNAGVAMSGDKDTIDNSVVSKESTGVVVGKVSNNRISSSELDTAITAENQTSVKADNSKVNISNTFQNIPPWILILLILGWVLPTPTSMVKNYVEWRKENYYKRITNTRHGKY
jgi:hypothetical protein